MRKLIQDRTNKSALLKWLLGVIIIFSIVQCLLGIVLGMSTVLAGDTLLNDITIDGINVGGMTTKECKEALKDGEQKKLDSVQISIRAKDAETVWKAEDLGITLNTNQVIGKASTDKKSKNGNVFKDYKAATDKNRTYKTEFVIDDKKMDATVDAFLKESVTGGVSTFEKKQVIEEIVKTVQKQSHELVNVTDILTQKERDVLATLPEGNVMLAQYHTEAESEENRDKNLQLFCDAINGSRIKSGDIFSIFEVVGEVTEEKGYVNAKTITNQTQLTDGIGGGVCQVVTTLYNAALLSDMEIVDRTRHSFPVDYVPVGMDAAINWPETDFAVRNISDSLMYIYAQADGGCVEVSIYGMPLPKGQEIKTVAEVNREIKPGKEQVSLTTDLPEGEKEVKQEARTGYDVRVYREYYQDGVLGTKEEISHDIYPAVNRVVLMGATGENK